MLSVYRRQVFYDVARRRAQEASLLLQHESAWHVVAPGVLPPKLWHCDGAVACSLLASECALKATLLYGHHADAPDDLPSDLKSELFEGRRGHLLLALWDRQATAVKTSTPNEIVTHIGALNGLDRYRHRYGVNRPTFEHAQGAVSASFAIARWMTGVLAG